MIAEIIFIPFTACKSVLPLSDILARNFLSSFVF